MRDRLRKAEARLVAVEGALLVALLAVMVTLAFAQVILRHFGLGLLWGETVLKHLVLWTGFLGAGLAAAAEKHFAWEAAHVAAPERLKPWLRLTANLSGAVITGILLSASWTYFSDDRASGADAHCEPVKMPGLSGDGNAGGHAGGHARGVRAPSRGRTAEAIPRPRASVANRGAQTGSR